MKHTQHLHCNKDPKTIEITYLCILAFPEVTDYVFWTRSSEVYSIEGKRGYLSFVCVFCLSELYYTIENS